MSDVVSMLKRPRGKRDALCALDATGTLSQNEGVKWIFVAPLLGLSVLLSGCGGGVRVSGPNAGTQSGLGTVVVKVTSAAGGSFLDDQAVVTLDKVTHPVRGGKATFYNVVPGRYFVQARTQAIGLPGDGRNIEVQADKTVTLSLTVDTDFSTQSSVRSTPSGT